MGHKCFISYKKEDQVYRDYLVKLFDVSDVVDKSLDRIIESEDGDYIMQVIRQDYLADSTVTVFLIGNHSPKWRALIGMGDLSIISFNVSYRHRYIMEMGIQGTESWVLYYQVCITRYIKGRISVRPVDVVIIGLL